MSRVPDIVLADDLTGAAEVAGVAHRHGQRVSLTTGAPFRSHGGITVVDTDTRLLPAGVAARRLRNLGASIRSRLLFKKTDSVLRGPVRAELEALAPGFERTLLVPANPRLGRTLQHGTYRIEGRPLHRTQFSRDPHHPAGSADVRQLLGPGRTALHVLAAGDKLPAQGLCVGEAATPADVRRWARLVDAATLAAGGAEFFAAILQAKTTRPAVRVPEVPQGPALVISGSLVASAAAAAKSAHREGWVVSDDMAIQRLALSTEGRAWCSTALQGRRDAATVRRAAARHAAVLHRERAFRHLVIEGGATAAAIIRALGWDRFEVLGEWAPGIVALRPRPAPRVVLTLKPGSYAWPPTLQRALRRAQPFA